MTTAESASNSRREGLQPMRDQVDVADAIRPRTFTFSEAGAKALPAGFIHLFVGSHVMDSMTRVNSLLNSSDWAGLAAMLQTEQTCSAGRDGLAFLFGTESVLRFDRPCEDGLVVRSIPFAGIAVSPENLLVVGEGTAGLEAVALVCPPVLSSVEFEALALLPMLTRDDGMAILSGGSPAASPRLSPLEPEDFIDDIIHDVENGVEDTDDHFHGCDDCTDLADEVAEATEVTEDIGAAVAMKDSVDGTNLIRTFLTVPLAYGASARELRVARRLRIARKQTATAADRQ
ncbi:hypothetical protein AAKU55_005753 [Oxalobacteraceae bacterium GrIS 1.11]